jgi:hypothetical protein
MRQDRSKTRCVPKQPVGYQSHRLKGHPDLMHVFYDTPVSDGHGLENHLGICLGVCLGVWLGSGQVRIYPSRQVPAHCGVCLRFGERILSPLIEFIERHAGRFLNNHC